MKIKHNTVLRIYIPIDPWKSQVHINPTKTQKGFSMLFSVSHSFIQRPQKKLPIKEKSQIKKKKKRKTPLKHMKEENSLTAGKRVSSFFLMLTKLWPWNGPIKKRNWKYLEKGKEKKKKNPRNQSLHWELCKSFARSEKLVHIIVFKWNKEK